MIPGIEPLYEKIANTINNSLSEQWVVAAVEAIFYQEGNSYFGEYRHQDGRVGSFGIDYDTIGLLKDLRKKFRDAGQPVWGSVVFELQADGKFSCKWSYDNCDENGNRRWDADEWTRMQNERSERITM